MTTSVRSSMDRASDFGSEGWGFESLRARQFVSGFQFEKLELQALYLQELFESVFT
jgi:hypothetical protein